MKLVDVAARNSKELATLQRKVAAFVKKAGCNTGDITWSLKGPEFWVQVENDGVLADDIADIIKKSPNTVKVQAEEHKGDYMWDANVYIRPCSVVSFRF
jgi:thiamine phosphate synthase YjbQ (UPF0047 family)